MRCGTHREQPKLHPSIISTAHSTDKNQAALQTNSQPTCSQQSKKHYRFQCRHTPSHRAHCQYLTPPRHFSPPLSPNHHISPTFAHNALLRQIRRLATPVGPPPPSPSLNSTAPPKPPNPKPYPLITQPPTNPPPLLPDTNHNALPPQTRPPHSQTPPHHHCV